MSPRAIRSAPLEAHICRAARPAHRRNPDRRDRRRARPHILEQCPYRGEIWWPRRSAGSAWPACPAHANETLLHHFAAPRRPGACLGELEAASLVEPPRGVEPAKGPKMRLAELVPVAMGDRRGEQPPADASAAKTVIDDEPAQVRDPIAQILAVDRDGADDPSARAACQIALTGRSMRPANSPRPAAIRASKARPKPCRRA